MIRTNILNTKTYIIVTNIQIIIESVRINSTINEQIVSK